MPKLRNGNKGGFEPGLSRLRDRHPTTELRRSTIIIVERLNSSLISRAGMHVGNKTSVKG